METSSLLQILLIVINFATRLAHNGNAQLVNCKASDREALIEFKNGLSDPNNLLSSWQGGDCCQWWGIGCNNRTGAVITVDIHNPDQFPGKFALGGELRSSLAKLKSLEYLDLSFNAFNGNQIPTFFESFERLRYLNLANSGFGGKIPPNLGNISSLQHLDISSTFGENFLDNLEWVTGLTSLKYLVLDGVDLAMVGSKWVRPLSMLPALSEVHLSDCNLQRSTLFVSFANSSSLAVIDLSYNNLNSIPRWLVNISSLLSVDLSYNSIQGSNSIGFCNLPNLRFLNIGNNNLGVSSYQLFKQSWSKLEVLQLDNNFVHGKLPASIGNMTSLTHLDLSRNYIEGSIPSSIRPLPHLQNFLLSCNQLCGMLPSWLGQLQNLVELHLNSNLFNGTLPDNLGQISKLSTLDVSSNHLTGNLPESMGKLSLLKYLDVSSNRLVGIVSESHFLKLKKLVFLDLSFNSLIFNFSPNWVPAFQLKSLMMRSCNLGPSFPGWLRSQRHILEVDLSNANISGSIPNWFWDISGSLFLLNFSSNLLQGHLPSTFSVDFCAKVDLSFNLLEGRIPLPSNQIAVLNLSNNKFSGPIPENVGDNSLILVLSLASNQITGAIPTSIGRMQEVQVIDLSRNNLTGRIPKSIGNCSFLQVLDLQNNYLTGRIPSSLGQLTVLHTIHLRNNKITGKLPSSFKNLSRLTTLDLGCNRLTGIIPQWIGEAFPVLKILDLRSNVFSGELPSALLKLSSLNVLDLAENQLRGTIPTNLGSLKSMTQGKSIREDLLYFLGDYYYQEHIVVNTKGQSLEYTRTLSFLTCIDISGNYLHGELPHEVTKLEGLVILNLSRNHISGQIPQDISKLCQLASLDRSSNTFSGPLPPSMVSMSFLEYLNVSYNNFSGLIPYSGQMATFEASSFAGNPRLCGAPLVVECFVSDPPVSGVIREIDNRYAVDKWFYLAIGLGFAVGLLIPYLIMSTKRSWSFVYFDSVDKTVDEILYLGCKTAAHFRNYCFHRH
ncbi:hypothetical protein P3X46_013606 [Hevea brasiliensis]|uniref:Leucine-rich repeat-containing N-terminal plant-type domain-containing protein n=2 Tax=Hevea brasiliensis TaxID=3981 RepID=A0ABQ9M462_HEVBR|nr:hypothetical protein P3X46_013606 [Hevea brasiliensis]